MSKWETVKLGDVCLLNMGQSPNSNTYNNKGIGMPFFQGNADFGAINPTIRYWCSEPVKIANIDDILISVRAPIGALNIANFTCCIGRGLAAITVDKKTAERKFIWYMLKSKINELQSKGTGSTFKAINKTTLNDISFTLPPLEIQKQIAENLDKVTRTIDLCNAILEKLDLLVKARFVEMFGDPDFNPKGWIEYALSEKIDVLGGYAFKSDFFDEEKGIPVLRIGNVNTGYFRPINMVYWHEDNALKRYVIYPGDVVMSLTGTVGKDDYGNVCIIGNDYDKYYLNQRNAKLEIKEGLDKCYLSHLLKFESIKKRLTGISRGVRQANIANKDILNLVVPIPPLVLQNQFADFVTQTDKTKSKVKQTLEKAETLKKALMQKYFG